MKYRYLRIAFSAVCGIICLLLIVLWVRSFWVHDFIRVQHGILIDGNARAMGQIFTFVSSKGRCTCVHVTNDAKPWWFRRNILPYSPEEGEVFPFNVRQNHIWMGFDAYWSSTTAYGVFAPHWFLVMLTASLATLPWIRWSRRFSLRTLLIAITLVAVGLGLIVAFSR
jgi:hypothetical protein